MFRQSIRRFATAADSASPYGIRVGKVQGTVNGFTGGAHLSYPEEIGNSKVEVRDLDLDRVLTSSSSNSNRKHSFDPS